MKSTRLLRQLTPASLLVFALLSTTVLLAQHTPPVTSRPASTGATASSSTTTSRPFVSAADQAAAAREWIGKPAMDKVVDAFGPGCEFRIREYKTPRPLRMWIAKVDLSAPSVRVTETEPTAFDGENARFETRAATTLDFATNRGVQIAFNASAFAPMRSRVGEPMDVIGLAATRGHIWSPPITYRNYGAMYFDRTGRVSMSGPPLVMENVWDVVPGFRMLVDDEKQVVADDEANNDFGDLNPRTAVACDKEGKTLWIAIIDGRQNGVSEGITLVELACLFQSLGAWDALNLDGGGSSTLVLESSEGHFGVANTPVGQKIPGSLRLVSNNVGIYLPGRGPTPGGPAINFTDALVRMAKRYPLGGGFRTADEVEMQVVRTWLDDGDPTHFDAIRSDRGRLLLLLVEATRARGTSQPTTAPARVLGLYGVSDADAFLRSWYGIGASQPASAASKSQPTSAPADGPLAALLAVGGAQPVGRVDEFRRGDFADIETLDGRRVVGLYWGRDFDSEGKQRIWLWTSGEQLRGLPPPLGDAAKSPAAGCGYTWFMVDDEMRAGRIFAVRPSLRRPG